MRSAFSESGLAKISVILIVVVIASGSIGVGYFALNLFAPRISPTPSPSPTPTPTATPTPNPTPTSTPTAAPTPSATPSATPTPSPTPIATPTSTPTPTPIPKWNKTYGGTKEDIGRSMVRTNDGGYAVAGNTNSFGDSLDVYLVKTDASGNMQWNQTYGGTNSDFAFSVVQTSDGGYAVAGGTAASGASQDVYLVRTDNSGNMLWNMTYGGAKVDYASSLVQTSDGGFAIAGSTNSYGAGEVDVYLIKTSSAGAMLWNKTYGGIKGEEGRSMVQTSDGGYLIAGITYSFGAGNADMYLVKTDAAGNTLWTRTYGGTNDEAGYSVVQTSDGGYAVAGAAGTFSTSGADVYLVKTDATGNMLWNKTFGGTQQDVGLSVVQTSDGGYAVTGFTLSFGAGNVDIYLVKTDSAGNKLWDRTYGGTYDDLAWSLVQASDGGYIIAGSTLSFGTGGDVYLLKTDSAGNI